MHKVKHIRKFVAELGLNLRQHSTNVFNRQQFASHLIFLGMKFCATCKALCKATDPNAVERGSLNQCRIWPLMFL